MIKTSMMGYGQVLLMRGKLETARNALKEGLPMEQAARITGMPAAELVKRLGGEK